MKSTALIFMVALLAVAHAASSQDMQSVLDGRTYAIEIYLNGTLDSKETLVFDKGMMDPLDCHQWGFSAATCQAKKSGEMYTFRTVCKSEKEGTMAWQGKVGGSVIEGTVVWTKEGQEPINYTFTGKQVK
jgi:hypothetical protein